MGKNRSKRINEIGFYDTFGDLWKSFYVARLSFINESFLGPPRILFYFKGVCGATTPQKTGYAQDVKHPLGRLFRTQYVYCTTWLENRPWIWTRFMI
ncbi:hypothetical protein TNIN_152781 [Trichonephila inaurata madagascariensis]|uniref:Uncharacterized protein n=1 Tax=Trichonephila inaurata madagascariensis TaxID=2747483 RepID=A0A8X6KHP7_9ARAC|nr:hypothetical protein TNIN_152781 [Trichonephila inaurata madagascariensis]